MDIFNATHNRLLKNGFEVHDIDEIEKMGASLYKSTVNNVILKKLHHVEEVNLVKSFSMNLRSILMDRNENVWNTYLLFCMDNEIDFEINYKIERDTNVLRKYAICNELDLNRIPFLDEFREIKKPVKEAVEIAEGNNYLQEIVNYLKENDGQQNKLSINQVDELIDRIIKMVETKL